MHQLFGLLAIEWGKIFLPDTPLLEIFLRGSLTYLAIFVLLRVVLKREAGTISMSDLLVIVLIADAAQNAMAADYTSFTDGLFLVMTIVFWSFALDWLGYHVKFFQRFIHPPPLKLIDQGAMLYRNMRKELVTKDELMSQLREQGIDKIEQVKSAFIEGDGRISIIPFEDKDKPKPQERSPGG